MKTPLLSGLLCAILSLPLLVHAAPPRSVTSAEQDRIRYMEFLEEHSKAQLCLARNPEFAFQFSPLLRKWQVRNEAVIRSGDAFVRTEARLDQITVEEKVAQATQGAVHKLQAMNEADLAKACAELLKWFGPDGPYGPNAGRPPPPAGTVQ